MILVLGLLIIFLLAVALYIAYFYLTKSNFYAKHDYNARNWIDESQVLRGTIRDRNGNALTYTERDQEGNSYRINNYNYLYSPIIGYSSSEYGKTGIEQSYNSKLLNIPQGSDFVSKLEDIYKKSGKGQDVYLTINSDIQAYMYGLLEGYRGALVVMEPKTGDILSMVSRPTFNVNELKAQWDQLINSQDGVMINRATQGLYAPGSTFKVISAIAMLEKNIDLNYDDKGSTVINGYKINNLYNRENGKISLREALINSSNTYFSDKSTLLENSDFLDVTKAFNLGKNYEFDIARNLAKIPFEKNIDKLEKAVTAFGQGKTLVTPLDMTCVAAAIANDGTMMKPRLVYKTVKDGNEFPISTKELSKAVDKEINDKMIEYLTDTAKGQDLYLSSGVEIAGKSGTAETGTSTNLWYIGFGPSKDARFAVGVILEDTSIENGHIAARIFRDAMEFLINNY